MRIGIVGLGSIAQKAYLPVVAEMRDQVDWVLCTRNKEKRKSIEKKYGFTESYGTVDELLHSGIEACFVHTPTETHYEIVKQLLEHHVHVFIDKPLSEDLLEVEQLVKLAEQKNCYLQLGFNRRSAPMVQKLKKIPKKNMLFLQKNTANPNQAAKFVVYDLFIHLIDTAVFLLDDEIQSIQTHFSEADSYFQRGVVQLETATSTAIVSLNTNAGTKTEIFQLMSESGIYQVQQLTDFSWNQAGVIQSESFGDWVPTLEKRGFKTMIESFVQKLQERPVFQFSSNEGQSIYLSHKICQQVLVDHQKKKKSRT